MPATSIPMTLRLNRSHTDVDSYLCRLLEAGIAARALDETAIRLLQPVGVDRLPGFADGWVSVQDWGAGGRQPARPAAAGPAGA